MCRFCTKYMKTKRHYFIITYLQDNNAYTTDHYHLSVTFYYILYLVASMASIPGPTRQQLARTMADNTSSFQSCLRSFNLCSTKDNRFCTFACISIHCVQLLVKFSTTSNNNNSLYSNDTARCDLKLILINFKMQFKSDQSAK